MLRCAEDYGLDWVTVLSDPYTEAEAFGLKVEYPEDNLPVHVGLVIEAISDINKLKLPDIASSSRMRNRVREVETFSKEAGDKYFIVGWVEGPLAEYVDLRGLTDACMDLYDHEFEVCKAMDLLLENAMRFASAQIQAGAHCIGIGDAACSQIGPAFYKSFVFERQKQLVDYVQSNGAIAKLHICGDTTSILPDLIATGAKIIDVDHLVRDMSRLPICSVRTRCFQVTAIL
jgi:uroporphyrinogen decarboxylase